jgi:acyl-coenzyme A synthetase/AMP-(fatty) acid ligase
MLTTSKDDIAQQASRSKVAVLFDGIGLYAHAKDVFEDDRIEKVLVISPSDSFGFPYRNTLNAYGYFDARKHKSIIPRTKKYIRRDAAMKLAAEYTRAPKAASLSKRIAVGTGTSGTTGEAKCAVVSNEALISNVTQTRCALGTLDPGNPHKIRDGYMYSAYRAGHIFLSQWPFVSTSLSSLFLLPLTNGMTILCDPLAPVSTERLYNSIFKFRPNHIICTGPETRRLFKMIKESGDNRPLDFLVKFIVGGEGITNEDHCEYLNLLKIRGVGNPESILSSGYGSSECFAAVATNLSGKHIARDAKTRLVPSVGIPIPGTGVGIFDKSGNELDYCMRGEIRVNADISKTVMDRYYLNDDMTAAVLKKDGRGVTWLHTNDIGEIGEDGQLYYYCRADDFLEAIGGKDIYTADIANYIMHGEKTLEAVAGAGAGAGAGTGFGTGAGADRRLADGGEIRNDFGMSFDSDIRYCHISTIKLKNNEHAVAAHIVLRNTSIKNDSNSAAGSGPSSGPSSGSGSGTSGSSGSNKGSGLSSSPGSGTGTNENSGSDRGMINKAGSGADAKSLNQILGRIDAKLDRYFPKHLIPAGYRLYKDFLPESLAWVKTDRKLLSSYIDGYFRPSDKGLLSVRFVKDEADCMFSIEEKLYAQHALPQLK